MASRTTSLAVADDGLAGVASALAGLGYLPESPRPVKLTLLDTFDGRVRRAGLRLTLVESDDTVLVLDGTDETGSSLAVSVQPRFASDLPPSPARSRLLPLTAPRALLPQVHLAATRATFAMPDTPRPTARVTLLTSIALVDADRRPVPTNAVEVSAAPGRPKQARRVVDALRALGGEAFEGGALALVADAAGIDTAGFVARPTVPLDPEMPAVEGFGLVLANLAETIEVNWNGNVERTDPEFLHDLRVAVRRTRTVLGESRNVLPAEVVATGRERFGRLGALTAPARDLDVLLIEWDRYAEPLGGTAARALRPVRELLERRQDEAHARLERAMRSRDTMRWHAAWRHSMSAGLVGVGPHADRALGRVVAKRIDRAQHRLVAHGRAIGPDSPAAQLHDLRKDAKKLRYLLECFGSLLPERRRARFVERLKLLQENLGEHQDAEVHEATIREIASTFDARATATETIVAIGRLVQRLDTLRVESRAEFAERFAAYDTPQTQAALDEVIRRAR
jgi:CHAD domain-containing protein